MTNTLGWPNFLVDTPQLNQALLWVTYLPHKALAEVSKHNEPITYRKKIWNSIGSEVNWFQIQLFFELQLIWMIN